MIPVGIKNNSNNYVSVPLFDEQANANGDFTQGYVASDMGVYTEKYAGISGWNKQTNKKLYFRYISPFLLIFISLVDMQCNTNPVGYILVDSYMVSQNILPKGGILTFSSAATQYFQEQISANYITGLQMDTEPLFPFSATLNIYTVSITPDYTTTVTNVELMNGISLPNIPIPALPFAANLKFELISGSSMHLPLSLKPNPQTEIYEGILATGYSARFKVFGK